MYVTRNWHLDSMKVLTRSEITAVLTDLARKAKRSPNARMNRVVFRLAACVGLRVSEIAGLRLVDVCTTGSRPHVVVRAETAKRMRPRRVPLWWDAGTLADLTAWKETRRRDGAQARDPFLCCQKSGRYGAPLARHTLRRRFLTACKCLGRERLGTLTIHCGRHTFISHALAGGRTLAEVRAAAGHSSIVTTSLYLHVAVEDEGDLGELFA
ncbi:MAG: site-specific integrase [Pirellulales bacterium]|nr:site-specific integrase [Pirellulales bacterium]